MDILVTLEPHQLAVTLATQVFQVTVATQVHQDIPATPAYLVIVDSPVLEHLVTPDTPELHRQVGIPVTLAYPDTVVTLVTLV